MPVIKLIAVGLPIALGVVMIGTGAAQLRWSFISA